MCVCVCVCVCASFPFSPSAVDCNIFNKWLIKTWNCAWCSQQQAEKLNAPLKINMEPKHHPMEKENSSSIHLHLLGSKFDVKFPGFSPKVWSFHLFTSHLPYELHTSMENPGLDRPNFQWIWPRQRYENMWSTLKPRFCLAFFWELFSFVMLLNLALFVCQVFPNQHVLIWLKGQFSMRLCPKPSTCLNIDIKYLFYVGRAPNT